MKCTAARHARPGGGCGITAAALRRYPPGESGCHTRRVLSLEHDTSTSPTTATSFTQSTCPVCSCSRAGLGATVASQLRGWAGGGRRSARVAGMHPFGGTQRTCDFRHAQGTGCLPGDDGVAGAGPQAPLIRRHRQGIDSRAVLQAGGRQAAGLGMRGLGGLTTPCTHSSPPRWPCARSPRRPECGGTGRRLGAWRRRRRRCRAPPLPAARRQAASGPPQSPGDAAAVRWGLRATP